MPANIKEENEEREFYTREIEVSNLRGKFIHLAVIMEQRMDYIITYFFIDSDLKKEEFIHLMLQSDRFPLGNKKLVLHYIIENHYPHYYKKYPNLNKDISSLIEDRNVFAHQAFYQPAQKDKDSVTFHKFQTKENKLKTVENHFSKKRQDELSDKFTYVLEVLHDLANEVKK
jgi:hypothetical protein